MSDSFAKVVQILIIVIVYPFGVCFTLFELSMGPIWTWDFGTISVKLEQWCLMFKGAAGD